MRVRLVNYLCTIFMSLIPLALAATEGTNKERMLSDLDFIRNTFYVQYAPLEWKASYTGWNLDQEIEQCKARINSKGNISIKDFQSIVKDFFKNVHDYHVGAIFYSTESATLPFKIKGAEGRYFFTYVDRSKLSSAVYPFKEGDEIISINNKPIADVIREFKEEEIGKGDNPTAQALAEAYFTIRMGTFGHAVPKGPITIAVKPKNGIKINSYQLIWNYTPEQIKNNFPPKKQVAFGLTQVAFPQPKKSAKPGLANHPAFQKKLLSHHFSNFKADDSRRNMEEIGARQSFIPTLGKKIWESDPLSPFYAYLFENANEQKIGYIRIPHYMNDEDEVNDFEEIIKYFNENTDALVIDQINNPGGSLFYLYALASMLTDQPLYAPKHKMSITQKEIAFALEVLPILESIQSDEDAVDILGDVLEGNPVTYQTAQFFVNYFRFLLDEWNAGSTFTSPTYLWGIDHINPHPAVQYTKPILLLINSLDFSGGDFFPAIMQDNKRVTLFGTRTAGAGGFVLGTDYPNLFGVAMFHYTASLAVRENSDFIENLGVTPDITYEITVNDLQNNYCEYANAILQAVDQILK